MNRMNAISIIIALGALFIGPQAFSISRVGNAKIADQKEGFSTSVPKSFVDISPLANSGLRLKSAVPTLAGVGFPRLSHPTIDIYSLKGEYPELPNGSRDEAASFFSRSGVSWRSVETSNPCILALTAANGSVTTTVVAWGNFKGIVLIGSDRNRVSGAVEDLVKNLSLDSGVCEWK